MRADLKFLRTEVRPDGSKLCDNSQTLAQFGISELDFVETGSIEWIRSVHIPYMQLYKEQSQCTKNSMKHSIMQSVTTLTAVLDGAQAVRIVKDLVLTSLANEKCLSVHDEDGMESDDKYYIQKQCIKFHEFVLCGILEALVAEANVVTSLSGSSCELFRYCYRKVLNLVRLSSGADSDHKLALATLPIARHLVLNRAMATLSLTRCIYDDCDYLLLLIELIDKAPWSRKKLDEQVCVSEGNVWLSIWSLLLSEEVQTGRYDISRSHRINAVLSLRRSLTRSLLDQVPVLVDLQRFLEELNLSHQMNSTTRYLSLGRPIASLIVIAVVNEENIYEEYRNVPFKLKEIPNRSDLMSVCKLWDEAYEALGLEEAAPEIEKPASRFAPICVACQLIGAELRCSKCKSAVYCSESCQLKDWPKHRNLCSIE